MNPLKTCTLLLALAACSGSDTKDDGVDTDPQEQPDDEVCDGEDNDGDGLVDDDDPDLDDGTTVWLDADGDSFGTGSSFRRCRLDTSVALRGGDCDDEQAGINPDADEVCDGIDNDCDDADEDDVAIDRLTFFVDLDEDGQGGIDAIEEQACELRDGLSESALDCDDEDDTVWAGAPEACDGRDTDCDPTTTARGAILTPAGGPADDISSIVTQGTPGSPVDLELASDGRLLLCGDLNVRVSVLAKVTVEGEAEEAPARIGGTGGTIVQVGADAELTLRHLTVHGGVGDLNHAGGVHCEDGSLTLSDVTITDNASYRAGGLWAVFCEVEGNDVRIHDNIAEYGGGVAVWNVDEIFSLRTSSIDHNLATSDGGGIELLSGPPVGVLLVDSSVDANEAAGLGGAVYIDISSGGGLSCTASAPGTAGLRDNSAAEGGAVWLGGGATLSSDGCDWGTSAGGDDNDPDDVWLQGSSSSWPAGDGATFSCDGSICAP